MALVGQASAHRPQNRQLARSRRHARPLLAGSVVTVRHWLGQTAAQAASPVQRVMSSSGRPRKAGGAGSTLAGSPPVTRPTRMLLLNRFTVAPGDRVLGVGGWGSG